VIHIVTLERTPVRRMQDFIDAMRAAANSVRKVMPNVWLVDTELDAGELFEVLQPLIRRSDSLLIIRAQDDFAGWIDEDALEWLNESSHNRDFR
jgi:hypothetical protein